MKVRILVSYLITVVTVYAQINMINGVPDYSQPPLQSLPSTTNSTNYCAPMAAVNIIDYWENTRQHQLASGMMGGLSGKEIAEYLGWYMDTNDKGSGIRWNGVQLPSASGTYNVDQELGLLDYISMDVKNTLGFPYPVPPAKKGFIWMIIPFPAPLFQDYKIEIDSLHPVKVDFHYWNIQSMGFSFFDPELSPDSVFFFDWGDTVNTSEGSGPENPYEEWNLENGEGGIGHAVTGVGYFEQFVFPPPLDTIPPADYLVVHDNWASTPVKIAIPWRNISKMIAVHLPLVPDLRVSQIHTYNDSTGGFTDTLKLGEPVSLNIEVEELNGLLSFPHFILIANAMGVNGVLHGSDTVYYTPATNKIPSQALQMNINIDSLFTPAHPGEYEISAQVIWDQNADTQINDPADINPVNDTILIKRTINYKIIYASITKIPNVPDINQPPTQLLTSTLPYNNCAPVSAANITQYWEFVAGINQAVDVNAGLPGESIAEYIGWFMDTNNSGNPWAKNGTLFNSASGTYVADQDTFFPVFVRWDTIHTMAAYPTVPALKKGYDWQFSRDESIGFTFYENEIIDGRPAKIDFFHWNIYFDNTVIIDTTSGDTVYLYEWGTPVNNSAQVDPAAPEEVWNLWENDSRENIGHAVTGVGYTKIGTPDSNYAIVHDNWPTTHVDIALPWKNWISTIAVDPLPASNVLVEKNIPYTFYLSQNYPNPFNPLTAISYQLSALSEVNLTIFNLRGQKVVTLVNEIQNAGSYEVEWDASGNASGIYYYKISAGRYSQVRKMILIK